VIGKLTLVRFAGIVKLAPGIRVGLDVVRQASEGLQAFGDGDQFGPALVRQPAGARVRDPRKRRARGRLGPML
jgi:hypothetical protein